MILFKTNFSSCSNNFIRWKKTSLVFNSYCSDDGSTAFSIPDQYYNRRMNMSIFGWYNNHEIDHSEGIAPPEEYRDSGCRKSLFFTGETK
jgi:hypothetical protein